MRRCLFIFFFLIPLCLGGPGGCGGGNSGTGGTAEDLKISGTVLKRSTGEGFANVRVSIPGTSAFSFTNRDGEFELSIAFSGGELRLLLQAENLLAEVSLGEVPGNAATVFTELIVEEDGSVTVTPPIIDGVQIREWNA